MYGVECSDTSLINDLGTKLAGISFQAGFQNVGMVYREYVRLNQNEMKIHLRSDRKNILN